jgi:hypothetical protein
MVFLCWEIWLIQLTIIQLEYDIQEILDTITSRSGKQYKRFRKRKNKSIAALKVHVTNAKEKMHTLQQKRRAQYQYEVGLWTFCAGYSTTIIMSSTFKGAFNKYLALLKMPVDELSKHPGYSPGSYADKNILGKGSFGPWERLRYEDGMIGNTNDLNDVVVSEYTLTNLYRLIHKQHIVIGYQDVRDSPVVMTSHLDG